MPDKSFTGDLNADLETFTEELSGDNPKFAEILRDNMHLLVPVATGEGSDVDKFNAATLDRLNKLVLAAETSENTKE